MAKLLDLFTNPATGKLSASKSACTIGYTQFHIWFGVITYQNGFVPEMWIMYGLLAVFHNLAGKVIATRLGYKVETGDNASAES